MVYPPSNKNNFERKFIIGFCDFKNSTNILNATSGSFFRRLQEELFSGLSNIIVDINPKGFIDKFAGDNIMFYYIKENNLDGNKDAISSKNSKNKDGILTEITGEMKNINEDKILEEILKIIYNFDSITNDFENRIKESNFNYNQGEMINFNNLKKTLGLRIGLVTSSYPIYLSMLGVRVDEGMSETDYTLTGEDVNLAARIESLRTPNMRYYVEQEKKELDMYSDQLYDIKSKSQTGIEKRKQDINIRLDDIEHISHMRYSIRVNKSFYHNLKKEDSKNKDWKQLLFIPKGFNEKEMIYILSGNEIIQNQNEKYDFID